MPGQGQAVNAYGGIGPVDLNRTLADYRVNTALAASAQQHDSRRASPSARQSMTQADIDRQKLARDIFARLDRGEQCRSGDGYQSITRGT